jgi:outer membrane receptor protein involved in Fe transport
MCRARSRSFPLCTCDVLKSMRLPTTFLAAFSATCLLSLSLRGDDVAAGDEIKSLDTYLVIGRSSGLLGLASAASEGVTGHADLSARPWMRRGELLEVVPGVVVTQHSGEGKANQYFVRGYNLDHGTDFATYVDGMPVNQRTHAHGQGYSDLNFVIPELIERIEYRKGPYTLSYGDFASAGAADLRLIDRLPSNLLRLEFGENNYLRWVGAGTWTGQRSFTTAGVEIGRNDGPWLLPEKLRRYSAVVRHGWESAGATYRITAMGYAAEWQATDQIPLRAVNSGALSRFGHVDDSDGGESRRFSLSASRTISAGDLKSNLWAYAAAYELDLYSNFTYFLEDDTQGDQFNQRDGRVTFGGGGTWEKELSFGDRSHRLQLGWDARADEIHDLGLHRTRNRQRLFSVRDDSVGQQSLGLNIGLETEWTAKLRTMAGLRGDGFRFDVESDLPDNSGKRESGILSPKLGLTYAPAQGLELYGNAGYGFHSNDARGVVAQIDPVSGDSVERATPLARSRGAEVGVRWAGSEGLVSTLSFWWLDSDSELVFVGDAGATEENGASHRYGIEWTNFYKATSWLSLDADVALTRARFRDAPGADRIPNSVGAVVSAGASVQSPDGWFGTLRVRYFGSQPLIEDNTVRAPSSTTLNLQVGRRFGSWELAVSVLNLLDRDNYDIAYYYESRLPWETDPVEDIHFHPAEPRTLRLAVTRRF